MRSKHIHRNDRTNTSRYGFLKLTVTVIKMLCKDTKVMLRLSNFLNIAAGILQGDTFEPFLFLNCLHYVLCTSIDLKKNGFNFTLKEEKSVAY